MTVITPKLGQKRLDSCDLARPKWAGFHEKRGKCGCDAFKIDEIALDDTVRVENAHQNGQTRPNNTLLGKYRIMACFSHYMRHRSRAQQNSIIHFRI